jgi:flagellar hook assembly protein FlgD
VNETITLDATGNWWGTTDPLAIAAQVYEYNDNTTYSPHVDYSGYLSVPLNGPGVMSVTISELYFSPNNDTVKDTTQLQATLSETADWTVTVEQSGVVYRSYSGSGNSILIVWDGDDDLAQQVAEGAYRFYIGASTAARTSLPISTQHVTLDITPPIADIDDAYNGTILQNLLIAALPGTANDATFADYQVEYGAGATPTAWSPISGILTVPVNNNTLDNWEVGTEDGTPPLANGLYTLRLTVNDKAGNTSSDTEQVTLDNLAAHTVTENIPGFSPSLSETVQIDFTLNLPADVTLNVYSEEDDTLVYTSTQALLAGPNSAVWDGTDSLGAVVAGGGYYYTLTASDGTRIANYTPAYSPATSDLFVGGGGNQSFNTFRNDFFNRAATAPANGRAQLRLALATSPYVGQSIFPDGDGIAMEAGENRQFFWDGRIPGTADIYIGSFTAYLNFTTFGPNYVVVRSEAPVIKGPDAIGPSAPYLEVKADPYIVYLSYGQLVNVHYNIDRQSQVTIKLLPPGVTDFNDPSAVLVTDELQSAQDHTVEWQGLDVAGDGRDRTLPADGVYTLAIKAVATDSGASTIYKAVLSAYQ